MSDRSLDTSLAAAMDRVPMVLHVVPVRGSARDIFTQATFMLIVTPVDRGRARTRVRDTLRLLEVILEDLLYLSSGTPEFLTLKTHQQSLLRLSQHFGQDRLVRFGERLRRARRQIDHNVSPKTALDGLTNALAYAP